MYILHNNKNRYTDSIEIITKIVLLSCIGLLFSPATFIVWIINNRNNAKFWLMILVCLLSIIIPIQYSMLFFLVVKNVTFVYLFNIYVIFGAYLCIFFITSRLISSKIIDTKKRDRLSILVFVLLSCLYLTPVGILHAFTKSVTYLIYYIEAETMLWIICVTYLFARFPEDELMAKLNKYICKFNERYTNKSKCQK